MSHRLPPEVAVPLSAVLREDGFDFWGDTRIGRLGGRTPYEAIDDGDVAAVVALAESYLDPSFS